MGICVYCSRECKLGREHVFPAWRSDEKTPKTEKRSYYNSKAPGKFIPVPPAIRDVCSHCNNGPLSRLDDYVQKLRDNFFESPAYVDTTVELECDVERLTRWLLKVSYNSARVNSADVDRLAKHSAFMLGDREATKGIRVFASLVGSVVVTPTGELLPATGSDDSRGTVVDTPRFRVGPFSINDPEAFTHFIMRHVSVNSVHFYLFVPDADTLNADEIWTSRGLGDVAEQLGVELSPQATRFTLSPPRKRLSETLFQQFAENPITYGLIQKHIAGDFKRAPRELLLHRIHRTNVEGGESGLAVTVAHLTEFIESREMILLTRNRVEVQIEGYEDDSRELWDIPEVRAHLRGVDRAFPYWTLLQIPNGEWIRCLTLCLCQKLPGTRGSIENQAVARLLSRWLDAVESLCARLALPTEVIRDSEQAVQTVLKIGAPDADSTS